MHYAKLKDLSVFDALNLAYQNNLIKETKKYSFSLHLADSNITLIDFKHQ